MNLSDAISSLLRLQLTSCAQGKVQLQGTLGKGLGKVSKAEGSWSVTEVGGQFTSQGECFWEPFLEPWSFGVDVEYKQTVQLKAISKTTISN